MEKNMYRKLQVAVSLAVCSILLITQNAHAQTKAWTWNTYRIGWSVPTYMGLKENNAGTFRMRTRPGFERRNGWYFDFRITPWKDARATAMGVANYGLRTWNWQRPITRSAYTAKLKGWQKAQGLRGYVIWGEGAQRGARNYYAVIGFVDRRSSTNFYMRAIWSANARDAGVNVINGLIYSFRKI